MVVDLVIMLAIQKWLVVFCNVEHQTCKVEGDRFICHIPSP
jgi:hypothetical protein